MWDMALQLLSWVALFFVGSQALVFIVLILWTVWTNAIKPRLISSAEIGRMADEIIAHFPDPENEAEARHERAWFRSDGAEVAYWARVRKAVQKRVKDVR